MPKPKTASDIFLSYSANDRELALALAETFQANGLLPFVRDAVDTGKDLEDAIWEALAESWAVVVVISHDELSPLMWVEIGAARAWNKPLYVVVPDPTSVRLPVPLASATVLTPQGVDAIIREVKNANAAFTGDEINVLVELYAELGVPADRIALDPGYLALLTRQFHRRTHKQVSGERLVSALIRLRKQGRLPPIRQRRARKTSA